jgi:hypothetical protein
MSQVFHEAISFFTVHFCLLLFLLYITLSSPVLLVQLLSFICFLLTEGLADGDGDGLSVFG